MERVDFLPLGSVVYLREGTKKVLIIARGLITRNGNGAAFFDYGGVPYPEGLQDDKMAYFQHDAITKVVFEGFRDYDDEMTVEKINGFIDRNPKMVRGSVDQFQQN